MNAIERCRSRKVALAMISLARHHVEYSYGHFQRSLDCFSMRSPNENEALVDRVDSSDAFTSNSATSMLSVSTRCRGLMQWLRYVVRNSCADIGPAHAVAIG
jgi:hypothetical protein